MKVEEVEEAEMGRDVDLETFIRNSKRSLMKKYNNHIVQWNTVLKGLNVLWFKLCPL